MLWMETYLFCCSVRLGVMALSVLSFVCLFVTSIIFLAIGLTVLNPLLNLFEEDALFKKYAVVKLAASAIKNDSINLQLLIQLCLYAHMIANILAFYGSLKLKKFYLLSLIFFELCTVIFFLIFHILLMIVVKNRVNLGILVSTTLAGGFLILLLCYNWAACVALYQIINLVNSEDYKALYGDDPFKPLIPKTINPAVTANVRVLVTAATGDIDEQKKRNAVAKTTQENSSHRAQQAIISVLPVNYLENKKVSYRSNMKRMPLHWPPATRRMSPILERHQPATDDFSEQMSYDNWQRSELVPAILATRKNNTYLESKWN